MKLPLDLRASFLLIGCWWVLSCAEGQTDEVITTGTGGAAGSTIGDGSVSADVVNDDVVDDDVEQEDVSETGGAGGQGGAGGIGGKAGKGGASGQGGGNQGGSGGSLPPGSAQCGETFCPRWNCKHNTSGFSMTFDACCTFMGDTCGASNAGEGGLICVPPELFASQLDASCQPEDS